MPFDPDAYLAKQKGGFDPDTYLKKQMDAGEAEATRLADQKYEQTKPGIGETVALNTMQGLSRNWGDDLAGKIGGLLGNDEETTKRNVQERIHRTEVDRPKLAGTTKFVSRVASAPIVANPIGAAAVAGVDSIAGSLGDAENVDKAAVIEAAKNGSIDAATAGALTKISPVLIEKASKLGDKGWSWLANLVDKTGNRQVVSSLGGTKKEFQNLAASGKLDDVGDMLYKEKVVTPFASSKKIAERVSQRGEDLAEKTRPIYDASTDSKLSSDELGNIFKGRIDELGTDPGTLPVADQLSKYKSQVSRVDDTVKESQIKELISKGVSEEDAALMVSGKSYNPADLRKFRQNVAKGVNFNTDAVGQQGAKQAGGLIREQEMQLIEKLDPALRAQNEGLFKQIHLNSLAEKMADGGAARSGVNNGIGMNSWKAAQVAATTGAAGALDLFGTGGVATAALIGRELGKRYGSQASGVMLKKVAGVMKSGKFAPLFTAAAERGPNAVAALHSALMSNPEYKAEVEAP